MNTTVTLPGKLTSAQALTKCLPAGQGLSAVLLKRASVLALDLGQPLPRYAQDDQGRAWTLRLPPGRVPAHGDVLVGEDGSMVRVQGLGLPPVSEFQANRPVTPASSCCGHDHGHDHHDHDHHDHSHCGHDHHH